MALYLATNNNGFISTKFQIPTTGWVADSTTQSGTTLQKYTVQLNHVYKETPEVSIGAANASTLPTPLEQRDYNLLKYITVDSAASPTPCLYLYASAVPSNGFYINVEGVE